MTKSMLLYGWNLSYYTGKVLCYLRYKNIPHEFKPVDLWTLLYRIKRHTGETVMPVLVTETHEWVQDSSVIIDRMEVLYASPSVHPETPVQRFASSLMEAWGDEWWIPIAMHTRWSYAENYEAFEKETGPSLLPYFPNFMQRWAVRKTAKLLRSYLPSVGVRPEHFSLLDDWTVSMLDLFEAHFKQANYLFGDQPAIGDFGLVGTMYGHLGHDAWPARELIAPRPHLRAWIDRMADHSQARPHKGFLSNDTIAPTMKPVFEVIMKEFIPMLQGIAAQIESMPCNLQPHMPLPRVLGDIAIPVGRGTFKRAAMPYSLWMIQRTLDLYKAMTQSDQSRVQAWLSSVGGTELLRLQFPRLTRVGLRVAFDSKRF